MIKLNGSMVQRIKDAKRILIIMQMNPQVGEAFALYATLRAQGKDVEVYYRNVQDELVEKNIEMMEAELDHDIFITFLTDKGDDLRQYNERLGNRLIMIPSRFTAMGTSKISLLECDHKLDNSYEGNMMEIVEGLGYTKEIGLEETDWYNVEKETPHCLGIPLEWYYNDMTSVSIHVLTEFMKILYSKLKVPKDDIVPIKVSPDTFDLIINEDEYKVLTQKGISNKVHVVRYPVTSIEDILHLEIIPFTYSSCGRGLVESDKETFIYMIKKNKDMIGKCYENRITSTPINYTDLSNDEMLDLISNVADQYIKGNVANGLTTTKSIIITKDIVETTYCRKATPGLMEHVQEMLKSMGWNTVLHDVDGGIEVTTTGTTYCCN